MANSSANPIQEISEAWASVYPLMQWVVDHPLASLFSAFVGVYLFWGLLRGLVQLTENLWVKLLRSPFWLLQQAWQLTGQGRSSLSFLNPNAPVKTTSDRDRLQTLVHQLEESNRAQQALIDQAKELLKTMNSSE